MVIQCINETRSAMLGMQNSACLTTFLSAMLISLCHFWQLYFKADWLEIHFLSILSFPFDAFIFTSDENVLLLPGLHVQRSTRQQSLMKILSLREREVLKRMKKDPSTTVVASVCSTGATVIGSVNATEFWQRCTMPPSFLLLLSFKMDLAVPQLSALCPGS